MGLSEVVEAGDLRASLEAQRDDLARRLENADDRAAAALHQRLSIVLEKIDKIPSGRGVSKLDRIASTVTDELAERREGRKPDAKAAPRARGGRKPRA